ncbi:unnamed protein product [Dovyalis caffra]|uniref:Uncharacterized protein n=1 Tax=Dovyalis caffra TaxID=77055 RepID=A0AAV1QVZ1_9ROSI|nr:unnamed protein product [Dovyalis caffra]
MGVGNQKKRTRGDRFKKDSNFGKGQSSLPRLTRFSSTSVGDRIYLTQPSTSFLSDVSLLSNLTRTKNAVNVGCPIQRDLTSKVIERRYLKFIWDTSEEQHKIHMTS